MKYIYSLMVALLSSAFLYSQTISTIAGVSGTITRGYSGDGYPATLAEMNAPSGIVVDGSGNIYVSDAYNYMVRKVSVSGIITRIAGALDMYGHPIRGYDPSQDGLQATTAMLDRPMGLAIDATTGNLYIADEQAMVIRMVNTSGYIYTFAGNNTSSSNKDENYGTGLSTTTNVGNYSALGDINLYCPSGVAVDASGNVFIANQAGNQICVVPTVSTNTVCAVSLSVVNNIYVIAGNGWNANNADYPYPSSIYLGGYSGNGGPATAAELYWPRSVAVDGSGNVYFSDTHNHCVRMVNNSGIISTIVGNGYGASTSSGGYSGDGGQATLAELFSPAGLAFDASYNLYIADQANNCIRRVDHSSNIITTYAGNNAYGYVSGDGGPPTSAELGFPIAVTYYTTGSTLYIADFFDCAIRAVH